MGNYFYFIFREVVMDTTQNVPYSTLMTKIDVSFGAWGLYNFYKMQVTITTTLTFSHVCIINLARAENSIFGEFHL